VLCCCNDVILLLLLRLVVGCSISISRAVGALVVEWCVPWGQHESDIDEALGGEEACDCDYDASDREDKDDKDDGARPSVIDRHQRFTHFNHERQGGPQGGRTAPCTLAC
jgi:hypothetical protein